MPRPKLIYYGSDDYGDPWWVPPVADYRACSHPREMLRFDPRYGLPVAMYCRACGWPRIHPFHGMTSEDIEENRLRAANLARELGWDS